MARRSSNKIINTLRDFNELMQDTQNKRELIDNVDSYSIEYFNTFVNDDSLKDISSNFYDRVDILLDKKYLYASIITNKILSISYKDGRETITDGKGHIVKYKDVYTPKYDSSLEDDINNIVLKRYNSNLNKILEDRKLKNTINNLRKKDIEYSSSDEEELYDLIDNSNPEEYKTKEEKEDEFIEELIIETADKIKADRERIWSKDNNKISFWWKTYAITKIIDKSLGKKKK